MAGPDGRAPERPASGVSVGRYVPYVIRKRSTSAGETRYGVELRRPDRSKYQRTFRTRKATARWQRERCPSRTAASGSTRPPGASASRPSRRSGSPSPAGAPRSSRATATSSTGGSSQRSARCASRRSPPRTCNTYSVCRSVRPLVWCSALLTLRIGELAGLQVRDLDLERGTLTVARVMGEVGGELRIGDPKSTAGHRTLAMPAALIAMLTEHCTGPDPRIWVFPAPQGGRSGTGYGEPGSGTRRCQRRVSMG
jgi:hypothetical protein